MMPYRDPARPYVNTWFASSEGANVRSFQCLPLGGEPGSSRGARGSVHHVYAFRGRIRR